MKHIISVPDIHCEGCVKRINTALSDAKLNFSVSLDDRTVMVDGCEHCLKTAVDAIYDLGFTPEVKI